MKVRETRSPRAAAAAVGRKEQKSQNKNLYGRAKEETRRKGDKSSSPAAVDFCCFDVFRGGECTGTDIIILAYTRKAYRCQIISNKLELVLN